MKVVNQLVKRKPSLSESAILLVHIVKIMKWMNMAAAHTAEIQRQSKSMDIASVHQIINFMIRAFVVKNIYIYILIFINYQ